ncbi:MAG: PAS domain S-box protein [Ferruginibacter sp.]|nr:PAS domain S-box protein [Ferruginibacter sp.]
MQKFEALFQYASTGILIVNSKYEIVLANNFLVDMFGYQIAAEIVGKPIEFLIPNRYHTSHLKHTSNYTTKPERRPMGIGKDLFAIRKDGAEFLAEISLSNYTTNDEMFTIAFVNDITKRKRIETDVLQQKEKLAATNLQIEELNNELEKKVNERTEQLQKTLQELEQSKDELQQLLSKEKELGDLKSRFVSMASHEFRTPLSTILSSASLLAKYTETQQQENRDKHIQRIKGSVNNLTDLLNEFLSIGKLEDGKITTHYGNFNIQEMLQAVCNEMQIITKPNQQIVYNHTGSTMVYLDPSLLKNAVLNLISNAIKFSLEGGIIKVNSSIENNTLSIAIKDNGLGISIQDQEHLFERFFRGTNVINIQGTGLGLHIVGKYIELMNGTINFVSQLEKGSTFTITFSTAMPI